MGPFYPFGQNPIFYPAMNPMNQGFNPVSAQPPQNAPQAGGPLSWEKVAGVADTFLGQNAGNLVRKIKMMVNVQSELKSLTDAAQAAYQNAAIITDKPLAVVQAEAEAMLRDPQFWISHKDAIRDAVLMTITNIYVQRNVAPSRWQSFQSGGFPAQNPQAQPQTQNENASGIKMTVEGEQ